MRAFFNTILYEIYKQLLSAAVAAAVIRLARILRFPHCASSPYILFVYMCACARSLFSAGGCVACNSNYYQNVVCIRCPSSSLVQASVLRLQVEYIFNKSMCTPKATGQQHKSKNAFKLAGRVQHASGFQNNMFTRLLPHLRPNCINNLLLADLTKQKL